MMFIIIPAKPFYQAKSRLASVLSAGQRVRLSQILLERTIAIAREVGEVVVISRDTSVRRVAKRNGAWALVEAGSGLNMALRQASNWVGSRQAEAVLVLPSDLPLLRSADLGEIIEVGQQSPAVVIAPCRRWQGTNALLLRPPKLIDFSFGPDSFERHRQAVQNLGLEPIIYHTLTTAFDLDIPEDLADLASEQEHGGSRLLALSQTLSD